MGDDLEGSGRGLTEVLSQHLVTETEGSHEESQKRWARVRPILEPSFFRVEVQCATSKPICSVKVSKRCKYNCDAVLRVVRKSQVNICE